MLYILNILFLISTIIHCFDINADEICSLSEESKCAFDHIYKCDRYCTTNRKVCDSINELGLSLKNFRYSIMQHFELIKYQKLMRKINSNFCKTSKYDWSDICLKSEDCNKRKSSNTKDSFSFTDCKCEGKQKLQFSCGKKLCAASLNACIGFVKEIKNNQSISRFNKC